MGKSDNSKGAVPTVLELMALSAKTAPKSFGMDCLETLILTADEQNNIADEMNKLAEEKSSSCTNANKARGVEMDWRSDAEAIRKADGVLLLGVKGRMVPGANCGGCGYSKCSEMLKAYQSKGTDFEGPFCMYRIIDLGIAISSAAGVASLHHLDNRIFQKVGIAARRLSKMEGYAPLLGIAVSVSSKNIFFDRKEKAEAASLIKGE